MGAKHYVCNSTAKAEPFLFGLFQFSGAALFPFRHSFDVFLLAQEVGVNEKRCHAIF
jgi:hypothetical protein